MVQLYLYIYQSVFFISSVSTSKFSANWLMKYVTVAGLIHSRAWIPPSINTALLLTPPFDILRTLNGYIISFIYKQVCTFIQIYKIHLPLCLSPDEIFRHFLHWQAKDMFLINIPKIHKCLLNDDIASMSFCVLQIFFIDIILWN